MAPRADNSAFTTDHLSQTEPINTDARFTRTFIIRILFVCQGISSSQIGKVISTAVSLVSDIARDQAFVQTSLNSRSQPSGDFSQ
ncbi:MAG: hypothetical protein CMJ82_05550 [Planctomycetaceae bacterium]|nr:hypothetical protein [Planctomycetaceae bacterium]